MAPCTSVTINTSVGSCDAGEATSCARTTGSRLRRDNAEHLVCRTAPVVETVGRPTRPQDGFTDISHLVGLAVGHGGAWGFHRGWTEKRGRRGDGPHLDFGAEVGFTV